MPGATVPPPGPGVVGVVAGGVGWVVVCVSVGVEVVGVVALVVLGVELVTVLCASGWAHSARARVLRLTMPW